MNNPRETEAPQLTLTSVQHFLGTLRMDLSGLKATGFVDAEEEKQRILGQPNRTHVGGTLLEGPRTHSINLYQFQDAGKASAITASKGPLYEIAPSILKPSLRFPS